MSSPIYFPTSTFNTNFFKEATRSAFSPGTISDITTTSEQIISDLNQHIRVINIHIETQQQQIDYLKSKNDRLIEFIQLHHNLNI